MKEILSAPDITGRFLLGDYRTDGNGNRFNEQFQQGFQVKINSPGWQTQVTRENLESASMAEQAEYGDVKQNRPTGTKSGTYASQRIQPSQESQYECLIDQNRLHTAFADYVNKQEKQLAKSFSSLAEMDERIEKRQALPPPPFSFNKFLSNQFLNNKGLT